MFMKGIKTTFLSSLVCLDGNLISLNILNSYMSDPFENVRLAPSHSHGFSQFNKIGEDRA